MDVLKSSGSAAEFGDGGASAVHPTPVDASEAGTADESVVHLFPSDAPEGAPPIVASRASINLAKTLETFLEDYEDEEIPEIPLTNIDSKTIKRVLIYCERHKGEPAPTEDEVRDARQDPIPTWDLEFITMPQKDLFDVFLAANFLNIKALMELCAKHIGSMIAERSTEEIQEVFNIADDLTEEEKKQLAKENEWSESP